MRLFSVLLTVLKSFKPSEKIKDVSSQNYVKPQNHTSSSAGVIEKRLCTRICGHKFFFFNDEVAMGGLIGRNGGSGTNAPDLKRHSGRMARVPKELCHGDTLGFVKLDLSGSLSRRFHHGPGGSTVRG